MRLGKGQITVELDNDGEVTLWEGSDAITLDEGEVRWLATTAFPAMLSALEGARAEEPSAPPASVPDDQIPGQTTIDDFVTSTPAPVAE